MRVSDAPLQVDCVCVLAEIFSYAVEREAGAVGGEVAVDPAAGLAGAEGVGDGGEVEKVKAFLLEGPPLVSVAKEEGLDLPAREEDVHQSLGVGEAGG